MHRRQAPMPDLSTNQFSNAAGGDSRAPTVQEFNPRNFRSDRLSENAFLIEREGRGNENFGKVANSTR